MPAELSAFAEILRKREETVRTADYLYTAQSKFRYDWHVHRNLKSDGNGAPVPPPRNQGLHPPRCKISDAFVQFHFELGNDLRDGIGVFPGQAEFQVRVTGCLELDGAIVELEDHWRVDTDLYLSSETRPKEPHPFFHFQRGGHAQDAFAGLDGFVPGPALPARSQDFWRGLLQSPGPRIPALPMCPVLAIDFAIGQHDGLIWRKLRDMPEYLKLIQDAQARLWTPFFEGLSNIAWRRKWMGPLLA